MKKLKLFIFTLLSVLTLGLFVVTGSKVEAATTNTTYTLDAKVAEIGNINQSTNGYFTVAKDGGTASVGGGACTATFTSIIDGNNYTTNNTSIKGIKMESKTTITFSTTLNSTSTVTVLWANNQSGKNGTTVKFDGTASSNSVNGITSAVYQTWENVPSGSHTVGAGSNQAIVLEIVVVETLTTEDGTYNVTYNSNNHGTQPSPDQNVTSLPDPLPSMSSTGYTFGGWYTDSECTSGNEAVAGAPISSNVTLYAKWTVNSSEWCTITFDSNGGDEIANVSEIFGSSYTLPTPTKDGLVFEGWSDGTNTYNGSYTVPSQTSITLTAQWAAKINFDESCYFTKGDDNNTAAASNAMYTVSGNVNTNADASVTYNGDTYSTPLKMEKSTSLTFTITKPATIYIAFTAASGNCKIQGGSYTSATKVTAKNGVLVLKLSADSYTITKGDTNNIGFIGLIYDKLSDGVFATTTAFQSTDKDSLRIVGTISGVTNTANIKSIELVLLKDGVATKNQIFLTNVYTSITGVNGFGEVTNTYYVVFKITGIKESSIMPNNTEISHKLKVTFTDDSFVESTANVSIWNN